MKKTLLLAILFPLLFSARASDTLTIRQVFNFEVGDTFDYQTYHWVSFPPTTGFSPTDYLYSYDCYEQVVKSKSYSHDSSEIYYVVSIKNSVKSLPYTDTIRFGFVDSSIIAYDTLLPPTDTLRSYHINYTTDSTFSSYFNSTRYQFDREYKAGLGLTYEEQTSFGYNSLGISGDQYITRLVYYSTSRGRWGTPCSILISTDDLTASNAIHLYPNPTPDLLHLSFSEASQYNGRLIITDILGQEVYSMGITESESTHDISILASGLYNWRIVADNKILKTGKVIKQ